VGGIAAHHNPFSRCAAICCAARHTPDCWYCSTLGVARSR